MITESQKRIATQALLEFNQLADSFRQRFNLTSTEEVYELLGYALSNRVSDNVIPLVQPAPEERQQFRDMSPKGEPVVSDAPVEVPQPATIPLGTKPAEPGDVKIQEPTSQKDIVDSATGSSDAAN